MAECSEMCRRLCHLGGIAQHFQYEPAAERPQRDKLFLPAQCQLSEPDLLCAFQGFAQDDIGFFGKLVGGNDIIGLGIIEDVDRVDVDELDKLKRAPAFELYPLDLFLVERSEEHTSELQSLMRISYAVFFLKKKNKTNQHHPLHTS